MLRACLAPLLLTCAVSPVLAQNSRADMAAAGTACNATCTHEAGTPAPQDKPAAATGYGHATPATSQGGGGDDESVLRMRVPKWNSFLPGMFR